MKIAKFAFVAFALMGLAACSTVAPTLAVPAAPAVSIAPYQQPEVDEAASAYVSTYAETVKQSLAEGRYLEPLAWRHLNAESCLDSRAARLLSKDLSRDDKDSLVLSVVSKEQLQAYLTLSKGYMVRPNGLEIFSCDHAGLQVARGGPIL